MTTNLNDDFITRVFLEDVKAQAEKAKTEGVSAYLEEPKRRPTLRPNERFLRNTIASVEHANKRVEEKEMWARRKAQLRGEGLSGASSPEASPPPRHGGRASVSQGAATGHALGGNDEEQERMLGQRRVRGRGGCGPRVGSVGPSLSDEEVKDEDKARVKREIQHVKRGRLEGEGTEGSSSGSSGSDSESEERRRKRRRKEKKRKKERRKRRKKEEKRRKEKKWRRRRSPPSSRSQ